MAPGPTMPETLDQHEFNIERWEEVSSDPLLASLEYRVETNCYGHIVITPAPGLDQKSGADCDEQLRRALWR